MTSQRFAGLLSFLILGLSLPAFAQNSTPDLNPEFAAQHKEFSLGCGAFLPSNVPNITETMDLCGGRYAFKIAETSMLEAQLFMGNGSLQSYDFATFNFRDDMSLDDLIASFYIGLAGHYVTGKPPAGSSAGTSSMYLGVDAGGAVWYMFSPLVGIRTDLEINVNPGVELLLTFSLAFRFDANGGG